LNDLSFLQDPLGRLLGPWATSWTTAAILLRIGLSLLMGAVIGWERSSKRHSAGLRTFMLVFLLGTLTAILDSLICQHTSFGFFALSGAVIIGCATIAVHSIFASSRNQIRGLTTAVGLWIAAVIGVALGMGLYTVAVIAFFALLVALLWFPPLEVALKNRSNHFEIHLELTNSVYLQDFVTVIRRLGLTIDEIEQNQAYIGSGLSVYSIAISISNAMLKKYKTHAEIIEALKSLEYIYHIEEMRG